MSPRSSPVRGPHYGNVTPLRTRDAPAPTPAASPKVEIRDLHFFYKDFEALKGISLPIHDRRRHTEGGERAAELVAPIAPELDRQTVLVHLRLDLVVDVGSVEIDGHDLHTLGGGRRRELLQPGQFLVTFPAPRGPADEQCRLTVEVVDRDQ